MEKDENKKSKTTLKREKQRDELISVAKRMIAENGLQSLKARDLADAIGVALGGIYNIIQDLDELILLVSAETLSDLERILDQALKKAAPQTAQDELIVLGRAYHHFARENYNLWRTLFDHKPPEDHLSERVSTQRLRPFQPVVASLAGLMPDANSEQTALFTQTLFSCIHGMVLIGLDSRDVGVRKALLDEQIALLISTVCAGLSLKS